MQILDLSFATPYLNLACDEALLQACEAGAGKPVLRFWETDHYFVVLGHANKAHVEADIDACRRFEIPILRRSSGGGSVVNGPGCLNYTLVLPNEPGGPVGKVNQTYAYILARQKRALQTLLNDEIEILGISDLAIGQLKFSGNAQRRKKNYILFHGTFLLNFDFSWVTKLLPFPSQQPDYRKSRHHSEFLMNLNLPVEKVKQCLQKEWEAYEPYENVPYKKIEELAANQFTQDEWNFKF